MITRRNIDWGSISALLLILIPIVAAGCYQPLPFTPTRTEIGLGKGVGKIFFAGGFDALGNGSAVVDVLDPASGDVFMLQLPVGRGGISVSSIGTKVLFAGGQLVLGQNPRYYDKIDVYDTESGVMQTMDLDIGQISQGITSLVVGSRIILFSSRSTTTYIIDPTNNSHETLELPLRPNAAAFGDGRAFFVGRASTNLVINILNVGNMTWATPREVTWNPTVIGVVYYRTSLVLLSYTSLLNIDVNNAARQLYESTFSERNLAAYTLVDQELYLLGPGFVTVYLPFARLVRFRSSALFLLSGQAVENNGIIYCAGTPGNFFPHRAVQFDTRALLRTIVPVDYTLGIGYIHTAFGHVFRFLGRNGLIYYYNLQTNQQGVFNYATQFSFAAAGMFHTGRRLVVFTSVYGQYLIFDADTETWTRHSMPFINVYNVGAALVESSESYAVLRNQTNLFVLDIATNEWTILPALQYAPVKIVSDNIVLLEEATMKVYNMNTHQWRIGLEFNSTLAHALVVVHNSTILITGIGEGDDYRKLHVYNVDTSEYRVEVIMGRRRMKTLVHGDYVTFTGGYAPSGRNDISNRVDMYNVRTATWKSSTLPPNLSFYSPPFVELAASDTSIFIARENRVDVVDIESGTNKPVLVPISEPRAVRLVGSKVIIYSRRTPERIIGVYETTTGESFSFTYNGGGDREFYVTENFIVASTFSDSVKAMELTTFTSRMKDVQLFIGESAHFNASVQGGVVSSYWQHGDNRLENQAEFSLSLDHVTLQSEGTYSIDVLDQCSQRMTQRARLDIHRPPVITEPLEVSLIMCHDVASIAVNAIGQQVKFNWTLESESYVTESSSVKVSGKSFPCNSVHEFCVVAYNPSGSASSCNQVRVVGHDLVFDGPRPETAPPPFWLSSSEVTLTVKLMDEECTEHQWYKNRVAMNVTGTDSSGIRVKIDPLIAAATFHVEAICGSSTLESKPFKFSNVSSWTAVAVVLTVIGGTIGLAGLVIVGFLVRRRMIASKKHEIELENLLTQAKSETLNVEGAIPIVQSTTWEWRPSDEFTYKPIDKMPYVIDYSSLTSLSKDAVKVGVWNQSIIEVSLRDAKSTSKGGMRERLIDSTYIDIYAPQSPKYEIKVEPSSIELDPRRVTYITVSTTMRMTSKCKICLIVVNEKDKIYSVIEFKMSSGMSTWIDLDEIESNGEYLGGGGFGSVTLGTYRGQEVAVKKLLSQYLTDEMKIEFDREVTLMKDLRHPNIVQFVGASNVKNNLAIVIEFAPLGSIASVMEKQKLSTAMKLTMLLETAKALQFLHTNGIIHRDIKPQNVLVFSLEPRAPVHVKLTDFGTARFISDDPTTITKNVGTISFMAPEALGRNPRIDKSADVYSFAMLMWSMLCEQTPFSAFKWDSDIEAHVKAGNRLPFLDDGSISAATVKLIEDCWHHEPAARPSMASVVQRLAAINQ